MPLLSTATLYEAGGKYFSGRMQPLERPRCICFVHLFGLHCLEFQEGLVLAAQNAGSLLTLVTGMWADRLNGKWMVSTLAT